MPPIDPAILAALNLAPGESATAKPYGNSGFSTTQKISTSSGLHYFLKIGHGGAARLMFLGEFTSLSHISRAVPGLTAAPISHGPLQDGGGFYLLTEFLDLSRGGNKEVILARRLAALHLAPPGDARGFGFPVPTCCGSTRQDNSWEPTWPLFFSRRRLLPILAACPPHDIELQRLGAEVAAQVVPRLLGALGDVKPSLVHGDLWAGNAGGNGLIFDPSCCYAHREYEAGIMKMFGGFSGGFWGEYWRAVGGKDEPIEEYGDRVELYMLYHQLNHHVLFGSGYRDGAVETMRRLLGKYGGR